MENIKFEFKEDAFEAFLLSCLIYPFISDIGMIPAILIICLIGSSIMIIVTRRVVFYDNHLKIEKYKFMFKKEKIIEFSEIEYIKISIVQMSTKSSGVKVFLKQNNKVNVKITRPEIKEFVSFIKSKGVKIISNRNDLIS